MPHQDDFERTWQEKLSHSLDAVEGEAIRKRIMVGGDELSDQATRQTVIDWTQQAIARLDCLANADNRRCIMTSCACHYPKSLLQPIRAKFMETQDVDLAQRMLHEQFMAFLRDTLQLDEDLIQTIVAKGWGLAGVRQGQSIVATKIPKSVNLIEYFKETDPDRKRQLYCHCPRVRDAVKHSQTLSKTYCYCGAGFYQGIWEEILQQAVSVDVLESVLSGGRVCKVAIHLPEFEN